jgi:casein kinase II subunit beta
LWGLRFLEVYQHATELYGLIHARYITTPEGLAIMRERYLTGKFGNCPRVMCEKQNVLPIGISEDLKIARVKVYCPRCRDIYSPKKKSADADGAYFGTSFPYLLLMVPQLPFRPTPTSNPTSNAKSSSPRCSASN